MVAAGRRATRTGGRGRREGADERASERARERGEEWEEKGEGQGGRETQRAVCCPLSCDDAAGRRVAPAIRSDRRRRDGKEGLERQQSAQAGRQNVHAGKSEGEVGRPSHTHTHTHTLHCSSRLLGTTPSRWLPHAERCAAFRAVCFVAPPLRFPERHSSQESLVAEGGESRPGEEPGRPHAEILARFTNHIFRLCGCGVEM